MLIDNSGNTISPPFIFDGIRHPNDIEERWTDAELATIGLTRIETPPPEPPPQPAQTLDEYAAQARFSMETSGITFAGTQVDTSRESQAMISGAYNYSQKRPDTPIQFKTNAGFVTLDAATMEALALAVGDYVQECFSTLATVLADIASGAITTTAEIDARFEAIPKAR